MGASPSMGWRIGAELAPVGRSYVERRLAGESSRRDGAPTCTGRWIRVAP